MACANLMKRYGLLGAGLVFNAFGVAFVTKASLGTSPIAAVPYSLSLLLPVLTMGQWTILYNVLLVVSQYWITRGQISKSNLVQQAVTAIIFGTFIDVSMFFLSGFLPRAYPAKLGALVLGCAILAVGAWLELTANVIMLPADSFVAAIAKRLGRAYGGVRVLSDMSMSAAAAAICWCGLHSFAGVREGTVMAALITGNMVKLLSQKAGGLKQLLLPEEVTAE